MSLYCILKQRISPPIPSPFTLFIQRRWKKPTVSAQTRLEDRVRDPHLDKLMAHLKTLHLLLRIHNLMSTRRRGPFLSLALISRRRKILRLNAPAVGPFLRKYPHVFHVFLHPSRKITCCTLTAKMKHLIFLQAAVLRHHETHAVERLKKLLMISADGTLRLHALRMIKRELGLPDDFRDSILRKYSADFRLVDSEVVALVDCDHAPELGVAQVEKWREKEYTEKWLSEFETKFAFPVSFPTGFKFERGFRERLKNWQRLPYVKPYEKKEVIRLRMSESYEKRAVAVLHELLSLTVEKMVEVDQLVHFRRDFRIEVNLRELLLRHPGIFYLSTKGDTLTVFLREAYSRGSLIEPNPVYEARRNMLDLVLLGCRKTRQLLDCGDSNNEEESNAVVCEVNGEGERQGDWVIPFLENCQANRSP